MNHHWKALTRLTKVIVSTKCQLLIKDHQEFCNVCCKDSFFGVAPFQKINETNLPIYFSALLSSCPPSPQGVCRPPIGRGAWQLTSGAMPLSSLIRPALLFRKWIQATSKKAPSTTGLNLYVGGGRATQLALESARRIHPMLGTCGDIWALSGRLPWIPTRWPAYQQEGGFRGPP